MKRIEAPEITLMGPGPSDVSQKVLDAIAQPTVGHLDPYFIQVMDETKDMLRQVFQTRNSVTLPLSAPGSAGMEACLINLLEPGDVFLSCQNGVFGGRMAEIGRRCGAEVHVLEFEWGQEVCPDALKSKLSELGQVKVVGFVHAETSTGVRSDAQEICKVIANHGALSVVDTVTSLAGIPLEIDSWGIDACYSGTQKCLSCPPGLSPVTFSDRALKVARERKTKPVSWFLDLNLLLGYWDEGAKRSYHHTAPVNSIYGLHESLRLVLEEGLSERFRRHLQMHERLKAGLEGLGISFLVDQEFRLPQLNAVEIPQGVDDPRFRKTLLEKYRLEIGAGLGPLAGKVWRIGLMGESATEKNVDLCLRAFENEL